MVTYRSQQDLEKEQFNLVCSLQIVLQCSMSHVPLSQVQLGGDIHEVAAGTMLHGVGTLACTPGYADAEVMTYWRAEAIWGKCEGQYWERDHWQGTPVRMM